MSGAFYDPLAELYDDVVVDPCFPEWADFLLDRWKADPHGVRRVLDVGCGTGLLARELLTRGCDVVGIDGSRAMLERARERLGPHVPLERSVLPSLPDVGVFDAAVSTFDTLNYLDDAAMAATMRAVGVALRPDGWWVFDVHTDALLALIGEQPRSEGTEAGWAFTLDSVTDVVGRTCRTRFIATREADGRRVEEDHVQHFFTDAQVTAALTDAGFDRILVVDEYTDRPVGPATLRATWIARRR